MKLKDAEIGKLYKVTEVEICDGCDIVEGNCIILSLMTRGLIPGCDLKVISKKLGMYELDIDGAHMIIRQPDTERFNIFVE